MARKSFKNNTVNIFTYTKIFNESDKKIKKGGKMNRTVERDDVFRNIDRAKIILLYSSIEIFFNV